MKTILQNQKGGTTAILHAGAWLIVLLIPWLLLNNKTNAFEKSIQIHIYINLIIYALVFYINYSLLVPKYFLRNKKNSYYLFVLLVVILSSIAIWLIDFETMSAMKPPHLFDSEPSHFRIPKPPKPFNNQPNGPPNGFFTGKVLNNIITVILISGFSLGLKLREKISSDEKTLKDLEKEKLNSELAFLKNQISPHFFFNSLNNIYALMNSNIQLAQDSVHKLSKLMRYLLYETDKETVLLEEEITFINNYLHLMKMRISQKVNISSKLPNSNEVVGISIPPLLFMPFLENAFKHGISYRNSSFIDIGMTLYNNVIRLTVSNSNHATNSEKPNIHSGIGLENVKKRLTLLFPNSHQLTVEKNSETYIIVLTITIQAK